MDKDTLPRWGWLLAALFAAAITASLANVALFRPIGLPQSYDVVTTIALMAPVLIYVGLWHDDERQAYWTNSRPKIVGDAVFTLLGALLGAGFAIAALIDVGIPRLATDVIAMLAGFLLAWGLFWWRNTELYREDDTH
ncbi:hypothetical protein [Saliphagus sp. LR7]|uniref:hypothetical protein n=1 Tax=Saliphagus sp. LR7 TaxID=2282654 RepID=UPI000DF79BF8|nr:hypothetical protein [Saliphagus sp. LR7]